MTGNCHPIKKNNIFLIQENSHDDNTPLNNRSDMAVRDFEKDLLIYELIGNAYWFKPKKISKH